MKTCLDCKTITRNDEDEVCRNCGSSNFRNGRPKNWQNLKVVGSENDTPSRKVEKQSVKIEGAAENVSGTESTVDNGDLTLFKNEEINMKDWLIKLAILMLPLVNVIYAIVNIASKDKSETIRNYFKAYLIVVVTSYILGAILGSVLEPFITSFMYTTY